MTHVTSKSLSTMPADVYVAFKKDFQNGIITVGNVCDANCLFCSQKWNPPHVLKRLNRLLTFEEVKHFIDRYLIEPRMLGSAFHVNSGEFFLHPKALEILRILKKRCHGELGGTVIFTNGLNLTEEHVRLLKDMNLHVILSLNMVRMEQRGKLMGASTELHRNALGAVSLLNKYKMQHTVALVPMRSNILNGDFEATLRFIAEQGTEQIMINRPGYTKCTPPGVIKELLIPTQDFQEVLSRHRQQYRTQFNLLDPSRSVLAKLIARAILDLFRRENGLIKLRKLFLYSESVQEVCPEVLKKLRVGDYRSRMVKSVVFGGNVRDAGMLLVEDYVLAVEEFLQSDRSFRPQALILPRVSFDINAEDLSMVPAQYLEERFGVKIYLAGQSSHLSARPY